MNDRYAASTAPVPLGHAGDADAPFDDGDKFQAAFQAGVEYLIKIGVAREEAEQNLAVMVQLLAQSTQQETAQANGGST